MKLKLDVSEIAKIISELDLYKEGVKVLQQYHAEEEELDARKVQLEARMNELKELINKSEQECQTHKNDMTTYIHLKAEQKQLKTELEITEEVAKELKTDYTNLKFKYVPQLRTALSKDEKEKQELFEATKELIQLRFDLLHGMATLSKALQQQQVKIWDANEILDDEEVKERFRTRPITSENATPMFWYQFNTFISKQDINSALRGNNDKYGNPNFNEPPALNKALSKLKEEKESKKNKASKKEDKGEGGK